MQTSDYSRASGVYISTSSPYYGNGHWWLRSPHGYSSDGARLVSDDGLVGYDNYDNHSYNGVVPALRIRL